MQSSFRTIILYTPIWHYRHLIFFYSYIYVHAHFGIFWIHLILGHLLSDSACHIEFQHIYIFVLICVNHWFLLAILETTTCVNLSCKTSTYFFSFPILFKGLSCFIIVICFPIDVSWFFFKFFPCFGWRANSLKFY